MDLQKKRREKNAAKDGKDQGKNGKKSDKMPSLKSSQLESAKLMAKRVITAMQLNSGTTLPHDSQVGLDKQTVEDVTDTFVPEEEQLCTRATQSPQTPIVPSGKDVLDPSIISAIKGIYKAFATFQPISVLCCKITVNTYRNRIDTFNFSFTGYMLAAAKIFNVPPVDSSKLNKMFTNKCTSAQTKMKKKVLTSGIIYNIILSFTLGLGTVYL